MGGGGGFGVLLYFHAYVGSGYFWGFKILNFYIWGGGGGGVQNILWSSQNWTIQGIKGSFLKVKVQNGGYILGC